MSDMTESNPLAAIAAMEAQAFRVGQLARRLLAEHSEHILRVGDANAFGHDDHPGSGQMKLRAPSVDGARVLATALGIELVTKVMSGTKYPFEYVVGQTEIDGIQVGVSALRRFSDDEAAAWRAEQASATEGGEPDGDTN